MKRNPTIQLDDDLIRRAKMMATATDRGDHRWIRDEFYEPRLDRYRA